MAEPDDQGMRAAAPRIEPSWARLLEAEFGAPYMDELRAFLVAEHAAGHAVYPPRRQIFHAFDMTPVEQVRVVILGQDPYHGAGQAMGLAFSVPRGIPIPPSLRNIFRELGDELGVPPPAHGDLSSWSQQGVLLLNTTLTVRAGHAGSHRGHGWERFTAAAISALCERATGLAVLLWGRHARDAGRSIDRRSHLVLEAAHPSPLSASNGFFGSGHFRRTDEHLASRGERPIDWTLPPL